MMEATGRNRAPLVINTIRQITFNSFHQWLLMMRVRKKEDPVLWFPRNQTDECGVKPAKPGVSCPPPHPGRAIIVWEPHKQKSRGDGGYNTHECVYKCVCVRVCIPNLLSIGMGSSVCMCVCVCVCVCVCLSDSSDEDWLQAAALLEATFSSVALH